MAVLQVIKHQQKNVTWVVMLRKLLVMLERKESLFLTQTAKELGSNLGPHISS